MTEHKLDDSLLTRRVLHQLEWLNQQTSPLYRILPLCFHACNAADGWVEFAYRSCATAQNPHGMLHGGVAAWLLDTTNDVVCRSFANASAAPSLDLHVNYLKGIPMERELILRIQVKRLGNRVVNLYGEVCDAQDATLYACSTANSYIPPGVSRLPE